MQIFFWNNQSSAISIISILLGILLLLFPEMSGTVFWRLLAFGVLLSAVVTFLYYLRNRTFVPSNGSLYLGITLTAIGLFFWLQPIFILSFLPFVLGLILFIHGIGKLPLAIQSIKLSDYPKISILLSTIIPLILGTILIFNPFSAAKGVIMFFGLSLIIDGICTLNYTDRLRK